MEIEIRETKRVAQCGGEGFKLPVTDRIFRGIDAGDYKHVCCYFLPCDFQEEYRGRYFCAAGDSKRD